MPPSICQDLVENRCVSSVRWLSQRIPYSGYHHFYPPFPQHFNRFWQLFTKRIRRILRAFSKFTNSYPHSGYAYQCKDRVRRPASHSISAAFINRRHGVKTGSSIPSATIRSRTSSYAAPKILPFPPSSARYLNAPRPTGRTYAKAVDERSRPARGNADFCAAGCPHAVNATKNVQRRKHLDTRPASGCGRR